MTGTLCLLVKWNLHQNSFSDRDIVRGKTPLYKITDGDAYSDQKEKQSLKP